MRRPIRGMALALLTCFLLGIRREPAGRAQPEEDVIGGNFEIEYEEVDEGERATASPAR